MSLPPQPPAFPPRSQLPIASLGNFRIMGDQNQGGAGFAVEFEHQFHHPLAGCEIKAAGGFVGEQDGRTNDKGTGQCHPLLLATGQDPRVVAEPLAEADPIQQLGGCVARIAPALQFERKHHVFKCREVAKQLETLENKTHAGRPDGSPFVFIE